MKDKYSFILTGCFLVSLAFHVANQSQSPQWKGTIKEEDGVKVIKNPNEPLYGEITFDLEENLSIGNEEDENYVFYNIGMMPAVDSEGNILVLDRGNYRIQKFDNNGKYLQSIGRQGQGPGEFEGPTSLYLDANDNIYINESFRRIELFDKNGVFKKRITLETNSSLMGESLGFTREGNFIARTSSRGYDSFSNIDLISQDGKTIKTVSSFPVEMPERIKNERGGFLNLNNLCIPSLWFCSLNKEMAVYGFSSEYELFVINSSGELEYIIRKDELPQPVTKAEKDKVIDGLMMGMVVIEGMPKISRRKIASTMKFPKYKPFYRRIIKDDKDRIYVERFKFPFDRDDSADFEMFNKDGYFLYKVRISTFYPPVIKNGYMYARTYDYDTGYSKIKRYKIKNWGQIKT